MTVLRGWGAIGCGFVLVAAVAYGVSGAVVRAGTKRVDSPCAHLVAVATWSPSGKRIAFVGNGLRSSAICVADAHGRHAQPLRQATCRRRGYCRLIKTPAELYWLRPTRLLIGNVLSGIFSVPLGGKPSYVGASTDENGAFSVDVAGDRLAYGRPGCDTVSCLGPITVLSVPKGAVVGKIGASSDLNFAPSLSPDGKRVAFVANTQTSSGVWTASVDGTHLQQLKQCGGEPLWSPNGGKIACPGTGSKFSALLLVSPQGGASTTLIPPVAPSDGVQNGHIFGWSPNGQHIALLYGRCGCRLDVVDVRTGKTRQLLGGAASAYVAWSPDSRRLLVTEPSRKANNCFLLWRLPADGAKPRLLRTCS